jgi:MFS family permease
MCSMPTTRRTDQTPSSVTAADVAAATRATYLAFIGSGFAFASWAARIPQVRDRLHLSPASLGLVLLALAIGSLIALPLAGVVVHRFGSRRAVASTAVLLGVAFVIIALGYLVGVVPVFAGLFLAGFANGTWDVAMNVQGAMVERHLGRAIMPRFHAGFSVGTVAGALVGAAAVAGNVPVTAHLLVVAALVTIVIPRSVRRFLSDREEDPSAQGDPGAEGVQRSSPFARWREPRTLLIGMFVLAFVFGEGSGNDWISVALIDGYHVSAAVGTLGFATFLAAMTSGRWFGPALLDHFGRVWLLRALVVLAVGGVVLFVLSPTIWLAFLGAVLWGVGVSLGFPVGMSAAADEPAAAAPRVSVVASIGYCGFLGGPPLLGFLGQAFTILSALLAVGVLLVASLPLTAALAPPRTTEVTE